MKKIVGEFCIASLLFVLLVGASKPQNQTPNEGSKAGGQTTEKSVEQKGTNSALGGVLINSIGMQIKLILPGSFLMGSPDSDKNRDNNEGPQHKVELNMPFFLGVYEVTQEQYEKVMGKNPSDLKGAKLPVENVSWNDAQDFCRKLSQQEKSMTYRLPTEAEWEYAARAGTRTAYYWGDTYDGRYAWSSQNSGGKTHEVGTSQANPWGLYDMSGNVMEWCEDWKADYPAGDQIDPKGAASGSERVFRGGSWNYDPLCCRSTFRIGNAPDSRTILLGFRVVAVQTMVQQSMDLARNTAQKNACIENLTKIYGATEQWALETNKNNGNACSFADLAPYFNGTPGCPAGGIYKITVVGTPPTCNIPGHVLP